MGVLEDIAAKLEEVRSGQRQIVSKLNRVLGMELSDARRDKMANKSLEKLTNEVSETGNAVDGAVALLNDLSQRIRDNSDDPAALAKLADDLDAQQRKLAEAIVANTPLAPSGM